MFKEWSAEADPGLMQAIMTIFDVPPSLLLRKESLRTIVNLEARKGT